ncbi:MarR family transcriptional regulator [Nocardia panacis]|uniref:MarR family transcriptional regulator n=1 Tax=Nocardia panacis TaxID=2340916 RepID=A0A3A4JM49_9NOCA|nr:MarR family winged helix-turn-helix transcriptional regulator [Nocardia panacis]RJO69841.1 MarR family transcriptional regulator [Nocardia panacis]
MRSGAEPDRANYFPRLADERVDIALCRAAAQVAKAAETHAGAQGLGVGQHLVLKMLAGAGPCAQQTLCEELRIDRSVMVGLCDDLEGAEYIRRERNPKDRRSYAVTVTEAGLTRLKQAEGAVPGFLDATFAPLSVAERRQLTDLLGKLLGIGE